MRNAGFDKNKSDSSASRKICFDFNFYFLTEGIHSKVLKATNQSLFHLA
jgi:hypothetical protein